MYGKEELHFIEDFSENNHFFRITVNVDKLFTYCSSMNGICNLDFIAKLLLKGQKLFLAYNPSTRLYAAVSELDDLATNLPEVPIDFWEYPRLHETLFERAITNHPINSSLKTGFSSVDLSNIEKKIILTYFLDSLRSEEGLQKSLIYYFNPKVSLKYNHLNRDLNNREL